jgi:hypothetical protein
MAVCSAEVRQHYDVCTKHLFFVYFNLSLSAIFLLFAAQAIIMPWSNHKRLIVMFVLAVLSLKYRNKKALADIMSSSTRIRKHKRYGSRLQAVYRGSSYEWGANAR